MEEGQAIITRLQSEKEELEARVKSVEENARELPLVRGELSTAREELDVLRKAEGELQARVQDTEGKLGEEVKKNADSLAGLERSLERARDREGELEKEVARLRQVSTSYSIADGSERQNSRLSLIRNLAIHQISKRKSRISDSSSRLNNLNIETSKPSTASSPLPILLCKHHTHPYPLNSASCMRATLLRQSSFALPNPPSQYLRPNSSELPHP